MGKYEEFLKEADWSEEEKYFSWHGQDNPKVNIIHEAIDRHIENGKGNNPALFYYDGNRSVSWTFQEVQEHSNRFGAVLKGLEIGKGDRVFLYMSRSPELYAALAGIIRVGAVAGPLFEAFMTDAVRDRLQDSEAVAVVTSPALLPRMPLDDLPDLKYVIVSGWDGTSELNRNGGEGKTFISYDKAMSEAKADDVTELVGLEDPVLLHYTSGSTGKPKGVVHAHRMMLHQHRSGRIVYDFKPGDTYWCTADPGWITGTSAGTIAPWLHGVPIVVRGGRFKPEDWYETIERFKVSVWFSAPTAFRMLMGAGDQLARNHDMSTLRHVLSAGEPLNPEVLRWAQSLFGMPIHDNWWMTETGSTLITNYPFMDIKPGSMGKPLPGIEAAIIDNEGKLLPPNTMGNLAIRKGWRGMMKSIWKNEEKYNSYFIGDWYVSGDSAYQDEDGYFWFQGRIDDVINTSGERVGPFEVESRLVEHPAVAEAGVIGKPDAIRGEIIKAFVSLREGYEPSDELKDEIIRFVKEGLAAHAAPRELEFRQSLPKTRSGKIMRRVLKAWELNLPTGDLSTMED